MSDITKMIEDRILAQAKGDVSDLKEKMKRLYAEAIGINTYRESVTNPWIYDIDKKIDSIVDDLIAPKLLPLLIDRYNKKFLSELSDATKILSRFLGEE